MKLIIILVSILAGSSCFKKEGNNATECEQNCATWREATILRTTKITIK